MNKNNIQLQTIKNNKQTVLDSRTSYYSGLVKVAIKRQKEINNLTKITNEIIIDEIIGMMTSSWKNTTPFNLYVSDKAQAFAKLLSVNDLWNQDYRLKFGLDEIVEQLENQEFLNVAQNLNDQDIAKLNNALSKDVKALNANVMLHWDHAYTDKMFVSGMKKLITELSKKEILDDSEIEKEVANLVKKQAIVWILKTEYYLINKSETKDTMDWENLYKENNIMLSDKSKEDYKANLGIVW